MQGLSALIRHRAFGILSKGSTIRMARLSKWVGTPPKRLGTCPRTCRKCDQETRQICSSAGKSGGLTGLRPREQSSCGETENSVSGALSCWRQFPQRSAKAPFKTWGSSRHPSFQFPATFTRGSNSPRPFGVGGVQQTAAQYNNAFLYSSGISLIDGETCESAGPFKRHIS